MKILLKCPTRSRPTQFLNVLQKYVSLANRPDLLGVCVSCDKDDQSMTAPEVQYSIKNITNVTDWSKIYYGNSTTKIQAVNADIDSVSWPWDIVVVVSDDMVPQLKGYDDVIRNHMLANFPDTDGILWANDGTQGHKLNTISILGRTMYNSFGYLYHPAYKSLFCDTEFTDICNGPLASKCSYIPYMLIRHEHPGTGFPEKGDALYARNQKYWAEDMETYISRKKYNYDWSILIPTLVERSGKLSRLLSSIHEKRKRICPDLKIEFCISCDNREKSVGVKREELLKGARGKYMSFVDDDDDLTDAYFEDALACIRGEFHVCRLRGQMSQYTFTHSVENKLTDPMARDDVFLRPPNHLNVMLTDMGNLVSFKDATRGEDLDWAIRLAKLGFLRTEYQSDESRIHYIYNLGDRSVHPSTLKYQRETNYETMLSVVFTQTGAVAPTPKKSGFKLTTRGFVST